MATQMAQWLRPTTQSQGASYALLTLRLLAGLAMMMHGWGKIQNPMAWMGPEATTPGFFQFLAAISEFGGGLAWILGLLTRLGSLGIAITMFVAAYFHLIIKGDPFVAMKGGSSAEMACLFLGIALVLMTAGPGKFSFDQKIFK